MARAILSRPPQPALSCIPSHNLPRHRLSTLHTYPIPNTSTRHTSNRLIRSADQSNHAFMSTIENLKSFGKLAPPCPPLPRCRRNTTKHLILAGGRSRSAGCLRSSQRHLTRHYWAPHRYRDSIAGIRLTVTQTPSRRPMNIPGRQSRLSNTSTSVFSVSDEVTICFNSD